MTPTLVAPYPRRQGSGKLFGGGSTIGERYEIDAEILAHYEQEMEKERLLGGGGGRLEYLRTRELLARHLPPAAATILDVGGGAGAYALPLAKEGYSVYLVDPVPLHVEQVTAASAAQPEAPLAGVAAGRAGGFACVVVVDRVGQAEALREHGASIVVSDLSELLEGQ